MQLSIPARWLSHLPSLRPLRALALRGSVLYALLPGSAATAQELLQLNFGVFSDNRPSAMVTLFKPTLAAIEAGMAQHLQRPVEIRLQIAGELDASIASLANGLFDFSRLQPAAYVDARRANQGIQLLAIEQVDEDDPYLGIIAVQAISTTRSVQELKGKSFAFGDEGSTIGRYLSQQYLQQQGVLAADLARYEYLGRNDRVGTAVAAGDYDAGALDGDTFRSLVNAGEPLRELARFTNVTQPWVARSDLPADITDALQETLLGLDDAELLKTLNISGFAPADDERYQSTRRAMEDNYRFFADPAAPDYMREPSVAAARAPTGANPPSEPRRDESAEVSNRPAAPADSQAGDALTISIRLPSDLLASAMSEKGKGKVVINLDFDQQGADARRPGRNDVEVDVQLPGTILSTIQPNEP